MVDIEAMDIDIGGFLQKAYCSHYFLQQAAKNTTHVCRVRDRCQHLRSIISLLQGDSTLEDIRSYDAKNTFTKKH